MFKVVKMYGGRGSGSGMASSSSSGGGGSFMSNQQNMEDYAIATGALDMGSEEETRAFMRTPEGRAALQEFMDGEREAGLTESDMRQAIKDTGSDRNRNTGSITTGGSTYRESEIPSRIQSFTTTGTGASGDWESKTYITRKGDAIKTVTKYSDGTKTTYTEMKNYGTQYDRTRSQFESDLAGMAKASARTGSKVTAVNDKKKGR